MDFEEIVVDVREGIGILTLSRPEKLNALTSRMADEITYAIESLSSNEHVRVIVLTGKGKAFCAGGDMTDMVDPPIPPTEFIKWLNQHGNRMIASLHFCTKPTIASVNGPAMGAGFNVALACDMIVCSSSATFGQVFTKLGLHPDCGGTYFLPRRIGIPRACELIFTGDIISAERAYTLGIINRLVSPDKLEGETWKLAEKIAEGPPIALALAKENINKGINADLETILRLEAYAQGALTQTKDYLEGVRAFKEKRTPRFMGM